MLFLKCASFVGIRRQRSMRTLVSHVLLIQCRTQKINMNVPNNDEKVLAEMREHLARNGFSGVTFWADDGSVGIEVEGSAEYTQKVAASINDKFGHLRIGDGVQEGEIIVVNYKKKINDVVEVVATV